MNKRVRCLTPTWRKLHLLAQIKRLPEAMPQTSRTRTPPHGTSATFTLSAGMSDNTARTDFTSLARRYAQKEFSAP